MNAQTARKAPRPDRRVGQKVKIGDPDGDAYDATITRREGDTYFVNLNGSEHPIPVAEVERQLARRMWRRVGLAVAILVALAYLAWA